MVIKKANKKNTVKTVADLIKPSKKYLYKCNCVYCNGKKVDSRTQEKHTKSKSLWKCEISRKNQENSIKAKRKKKSITSNVNPTKPNLPKKRKMISPSTPPNPPDSPNNEDSINTLFSSKPKSSSRFHDPASDLIEDKIMLMIIIILIILTIIIILKMMIIILTMIIIILMRKMIILMKRIKMKMIQTGRK